MNFDEFLRKCVLDCVRALLPTILPQILEEMLNTPGGEYIDTVEAAEMTGLSVQYFKNNRGKPGMPTPIRQGRRVLYKASDLRAWMEHRREASL